MKNTQAANKNTRRHFLLLQGPNSFFFDLLSRKLRGYGFKTTKINFNAGDAFFYRDNNIINFKYSLGNWPAYICDISRMQGVTDVILYDDTKPLHASAAAALKEIGVHVHVFSRPYFDTNHITLERDGANANSPLPHEPMFYMRTPTIHSDSKPQQMQPTKLKQYLYNLVYAFAAKFSTSDKYSDEFKPNSARIFALLRKSYSWLGAALSKQAFCLSLTKRKYFVATIDRGNNHFIRKVISSFAAHTSKDHILILNVTGKASWRKARKAAKKSAKKHSAINRVFWLHNADLRKLMKNAEGMITYDSVDGIIALEAEKPLIALGKSIYSFAGLTNQSKLLGFWKRRTSPNPSLYGKFKNHLSARTQINGDFYSRKGMELATSTASHIIIFSANFAVGNNVSENV